MGWITSHLLLVRTNGARQQRDEGGEDGSRRMPKTRRRHPGWKRGDRADVNIPPAELLFQKETRMRYVGPNDSSCLDAMLSSSVTSIRRRKRGMLYLIIWPIAERMASLFSATHSKTAATQQLISVSSWKAKSWGEKRKRNGNQKFGWTEIFPFIYRPPFICACLKKKKRKPRTYINAQEQSVVRPF